MKEYKTPYLNTKLVMKIMRIIYEEYNTVELYCNSELEMRIPKHQWKSLQVMTNSYKNNVFASILLKHLSKKVEQ